MFIECYAAISCYALLCHCYALLCPVSLRLTMCRGLSLRNSQTMSRMCELPGEFCKFCIYCDELVPFDCFFRLSLVPARLWQGTLGLMLEAEAESCAYVKKERLSRFVKTKAAYFFFWSSAAEQCCAVYFSLQRRLSEIFLKDDEFKLFEEVGLRCIFLYFRNMKETTAIETYESWYDYVFDYDYDHDMIRCSMMWHTYIYIHIHAYYTMICFFLI